MAVRKLTPETKTLRYMINGLGMVAGRASTRIGKRSFDLFGFVDVLGFKPRMLAGYERQGAGAAAFLFVQCTSSSHQANRRNKILESPTLRDRAWALIDDGHKVEVWGWIDGRHAGAQAFRRFELRRKPRTRTLVWHDKGVTEVEHEIIGQLTGQH